MGSVHVSPLSDRHFYSSGFKAFQIRHAAARVACAGDDKIIQWNTRVYFSSGSRGY